MTVLEPWCKSTKGSCFKRRMRVTSVADTTHCMSLSYTALPPYVDVFTMSKQKLYWHNGAYATRTFKPPRNILYVAFTRN